MKSLVTRNLKLYFYDKMSVFFSVFSSIIIITLYFLFLGKNMASNMPPMPNVDNFIDNWVVGGLLAITSVTTSISVLGFKVKDDENRIYQDFYATPLRRSSLFTGYVIAAIIIGLIISLVTLVAAQIFVMINGGQLLSWQAIVLILPLLIITIFTNAAMMTLVITFIHTQSQLAIVGSVSGMLIGFLTGIYVPIAVLPKSAQFVVKIFPTSHAVALFRNIMLNDLWADKSEQYLAAVRIPLGINFKFGDYMVPNWLSLVYVIAAGIIFSALCIYRFRTKK